MRRTMRAQRLGSSSKSPAQSTNTAWRVYQMFAVLRGEDIVVLDKRVRQEVPGPAPGVHNGGCLDGTSFAARGKMTGSLPKRLAFAPSFELRNRITAS